MTTNFDEVQTTLPLPQRPAGVMFHHFHGGGHPVSQGSISAEDLTVMIERLGRDRILPARDWLSRAVEGTLAPEDLCLTFDDNLRCQYDVALPVLDAYGLTAFWFVYTSVNVDNIERLEVYRDFRSTQFADIDNFYGAFYEFVGGTDKAQAVRAGLRSFDPKEYLPDYTYLSGSDKRFRFVRDRVLGRECYESLMDAMLQQYPYDVAAVAKRLWMADDQLIAIHADGHVIGLHSHTHPTLIEALPAHAQRQEYALNYAHLENLLEVAPSAMSHPNNSYTAETLDILHGMGIAVGFRANPTQRDHGPLEWPRHNHAVIRRAIKEQGS